MKVSQPGEDGTPGGGGERVLNATDVPLAVVPARRAVVLVLKDKAEVIVSNGMIFRSERYEIEAPSVLRLRYFVKVPYRAQAPLTRRAVFARDGWSCQYCGAAAENLDHVVPRSRGGEHTWENVVAPMMMNRMMPDTATVPVSAFISAACQAPSTYGQLQRKHT